MNEQAKAAAERIYDRMTGVIGVLKCVARALDQADGANDDAMNALEMLYTEFNNIQSSVRDMIEG